MRPWVFALLATLSCSRPRPLADARPQDAAATVTGLVAFPGAEGFGANARGGRGGSVCHVKTLAHAGAGSLQACFDASGARTVVFDVAGVIEGPLEIKHGQLTIAGQTAPGTLVVKGGVVCDNVYDPNDCNDVIVRHVRFRGGAPDSFRIGGAHDVILDHCSFASAEDENVELTRSRNVTIQYSVIAEPRGEHYQWGGVLINYSKDSLPLDAITIHHSVWNGVAGRLPEISCEENNDGPGTSNCAGHVLSMELSNNVLWDASDPVWFNRCTGTNQGNDCAPAASNFGVRLNLVGNLLVRRSGADADAPLVEPALYASPRSAVFASDNVLARGATKVAADGTPRVATRHAFPPVTYTPVAELVATLARVAGAFPRDPMDQRLASYLGAAIDARPVAWRNERGVDVGDSFEPGPTVAAATADAPPAIPGCAPGYTPLECYLNHLADARTPY